jgi:hypothetical protein
MIKFFKKEKKLNYSVLDLGNNITSYYKTEKEARKASKLLQAELWEKEKQKRLELYNKIIKKVDNLVENGILPRLAYGGYQIDQIYVQNINNNYLVYIIDEYNEMSRELGQKLSNELYYYVKSKTYIDLKTYLETLTPPPSALK